jgi:hypothetical protein
MSTEDRLKQMIGSADVEGRASEAEWNQFSKRAHGALFTRRATAALGTVALVGIGVFAAITLRPTSDNAPIPPAPAVPSESGSVQPSPSPTEQEIVPVVVDAAEQEVWFVQGEKLSWGSTISGARIDPAQADDDPISQRAAYWYSVQLAGPSGPDFEAGATTAIPQGTFLNRVTRDGSTLKVDLTTDFDSGGGSLSMQMRVAQIVYQGTQFEGIDSVRILIDGQEVDSIGGEGIDVSRPLTRRDFQDFAPNVVVETPRPGDEFSPGDVVTGFANVFEANVSFRVLDANGKELKTDFTTATCGSGCWGDFEKALDFALDSPQEGRIEVLTYSAEDGSPQDVISIPVMLVP